MKERVSLILFSIVLFFSCGSRQTASPQEEGDTVRFKYATQLSVVRYEGYTVATLKNPWKEGMILHQYVLVPKNQEQVPMIHGATVIRTPLSRSMIFSTVHCAMLMDFGKQDCIAGVADLKYIKIPWIQQQAKEGKISDVGDGLSPVVEKIIDQRPDALFLSPFRIVVAMVNLRKSIFPLWNVLNIWNHRPWDVPSGCVSMVCFSDVRRRLTACLML